MNEKTAKDGKGWRSGLWGYNLRILVGNTYWLVVTPLAASQLVVFWQMAVARSLTDARGALTIELLAPIVGAFLCAHALAPEQDGVGELVFVRPLSLEKVLLIRLAMIFAFVYVILIPACVVFELTIPNFPVAMTLLAAFPSTLFLSALAMALASATRQPLLGITGAAVFWAFDFATAGYWNPLFSLHRFADHLADRPMAEQWALGKALLLAAAAACYLWNRRLLGRPPSLRRWLTAVRVILVVAAVAALYVVSGAAYKVSYGLRHEAELGPQTQFWYQQQFRDYRFLPVARLFGPAFQLYVGSEGGGATGVGRSFWSLRGISNMRKITERYPHSIWADNAQFEIALRGADNQGAPPRIVVVAQAGDARPSVKVVRQDLDYSLREFTTLVEKYPKSPFAPFCLSRMAEIGRTMLDFDLAKSSYERLVADYSRSPQTAEAGVRLSALYLWQGAPEKAVHAADTAAEVAKWDVAAEAWLAAARAARESGDSAGARQRYQKASQAAQRALDRAVRGDARPSGMSKADLLSRSHAVMRKCERALAGDLAPVGLAAPPPIRVSGRVLSQPAEPEELRVAIGAEVDDDGLPSPFLGKPASDASVNENGDFTLEAVPAGAYPVFAVSFRARGDITQWTLEPPSLPLVLTTETREIAAARLHPGAAPAPRAAPQPVVRGVARGIGRAGRTVVRGRDSTSPQEPGGNGAARR